MGHGHDHSGEGKLVLAVTDENVGVWIEGRPVLNPIEFSVALVDLAVSHHFEIETDVWETDKPVFLKGEPTFEMVEDLGFVAEAAFDYLNDILPDGYYFDIDGGFRLCKEEPDEDEAE